MKVIYTRNFPPGNFHGINLFGFIFASRRWGVMRPHEMRHELIHTMQQVEMGFVGFYVWYGVEWLVRWVQCRFDSERAYFAVSLEREAYAHEREEGYPKRRRHYAFLHELRKPKKRVGGGKPSKQT